MYTHTHENTRPPQESIQHHRIKDIIVGMIAEIIKVIFHEQIKEVLSIQHLDII